MAVNYANYQPPANPYAAVAPLNYPTQVSVPPTTAPGAVGTATALQQGVYNQLPGYNASLSNIGGNIASETAGQLPEDVANYIKQQAAERGVATGTAGSQANTASLLDALGLQSLQLTQMGQQNFQNILPQLPGANIASNAGFYATPGQYLQANEATVGNQAGLATQNAGVNLARQGLSAGSAVAGDGNFTLPGDNSAAQEAAWWNQPEFGGTFVYGAANPADPAAEILQNYSANLYGAGESAGTAGLTEGDMYGWGGDQNTQLTIPSGGGSTD